MTGNNWYVITGGPSVGKSTLLAELDKLGHATLPEAAREVIDEALAAGRTIEELRGDERNFQIVVLDRKIQTERQQPKDRLTFFDRGMQDTLAYMRLHDFAISAEIEASMRAARYRRVFLLEPLQDYHQDYARTESEGEARRLDELLREAYEEYGMEVVSVPVLPPAERARFVLQRLD